MITYKEAIAVWKAADADARLDVRNVIDGEIETLKAEAAYDPDISLESRDVRAEALKLLPVYEAVLVILLQAAVQSSEETEDMAARGIIADAARAAASLSDGELKALVDSRDRIEKLRKRVSKMGPDEVGALWDRIERFCGADVHTDLAEKLKVPREQAMNVNFHVLFGKKP